MSRLQPFGVTTSADPPAGLSIDPDHRRRRIDLVAVNAAMHRLVENIDPAVVFGDLAQLCVPAVCDGVEVEVLSGDEVSGVGPAGSWSRANASTAGWVDGADTATVLVPSDAGRIEETGPVDYVVRLTCSWNDHRPTPADVALIELLGRCAAGTVRQARQSAATPERDGSPWGSREG